MNIWNLWRLVAIFFFQIIKHLIQQESKQDLIEYFSKKCYFRKIECQKNKCSKHAPFHRSPNLRDFLNQKL